MIILETSRLVLRPLTMSDAPDMFEYACDSRVGPSAGWIQHSTIFETENILSKIIESNEVWAIVFKGNNKMIGTIGLHKSRYAFNMNEKTIGYVLNPAYWGQGLMTEAVHEILRFGFTIMVLDVIRVTHFVGNTQSERVIIKNGFQCDGTLRQSYRLNNGKVADTKVYSITRSEFYNLVQKSFSA